MESQWVLLKVCSLVVELEHQRVKYLGYRMGCSKAYFVVLWMDDDWVVRTVLFAAAWMVATMVLSTEPKSENTMVVVKAVTKALMSVAQLAVEMVVLKLGWRDKTKECAMVVSKDK